MYEARLDWGRYKLNELNGYRKDALESARAQLDGFEEAEKVAVTTQEERIRHGEIKDEINILKDDIGRYKNSMEYIEGLLRRIDQLKDDIAHGRNFNGDITRMVAILMQSITSMVKTYDLIRSKRSSTQPSRGHSEDTGQISDGTERAPRLGASGRSSSKPPHGDKQDTGYQYRDKKRPFSRCN